jgi:hypothetical protein
VTTGIVTAASLPSFDAPEDKRYVRPPSVDMLIHVRRARRRKIGIGLSHVTVAPSRRGTRPGVGEVTRNGRFVASVVVVGAKAAASGVQVLPSCGSASSETCD